MKNIPYLIISFFVIFLSSCGSGILDKRFNRNSAGRDLDSIARQYSLDTALLIDGLLFNYELEGKNKKKSYGKLLKEAIDLKNQCDHFIQEQQLLIEKVNKVEHDYVIMKYYLGHKLIRGSASFFYLSTPAHLSRDQLIALLKSFESKYPLREPHQSDPEHTYYFYHNNNYYASVASLDMNDYEPGNDMKVFDYLLPGQPQDSLPSRKEFDSIYRSSPYTENMKVINAYASTSFMHNAIIATYNSPEDTATGVAIINPLGFGKLNDVRFENGKFYSNQGRSRMYIDEGVYEVNEFGDLYNHNQHPIGYCSVFKKIK